MRTIGAVDIGGTKIALGIVLEDGTILDRREFPTEPKTGFRHAMERVRRTLRALTDGVTGFLGVGVACPGPVDPMSGIIGDVGTLPGWQEENLVTELQTEFLAPVAVENDADAAALAEAKWGAHKGHEKLIYITVSTGIGCGIVFSGKLYRGAAGAHPEAGHQVLDHSGPLCYCKARGCWESLASGLAMTAWMQELAPDERALTAAEICRKAKENDPLALQVVEREGQYLGLGLANLVTVFAPDIIVLGGGVMKSSSLFLDTALKVVHDTCTQVPAHNTSIVLASLGTNIGILGAAQAWLSRYPCMTKDA